MAYVRPGQGKPKTTWNAREKGSRGDLIGPYRDFWRGAGRVKGVTCERAYSLWLSATVLAAVLQIRAWPCSHPKPPLNPERFDFYDAQAELAHGHPARALSYVQQQENLE